LTVISQEQTKTESRVESIQSQSYDRRHPYLFVAILLIAFVAVDLPLQFIFSTVVLPYSILAFIAAAIVTRRHRWKAVGFTLSGANSRSLLLFAPVFLMSVWYVTIAPTIIGYGTIAIPSLGTIFALAAVALLVGFVEEIYFRGMMLQALKSKGMWTATVVTALLFGPVHLENMFLGAAPLGVILQVGYATALGLSFSALVMVTGLIWPLVLAHALLDFFPSFNSAMTSSATVAPADYAMTALIIVVFVPYSVLLLRRAKSAAPGRLKTAMPR
jgi:membrane protease YdiL (CAAX protease family)